jgi:hypothetical protein
MEEIFKVQIAYPTTETKAPALVYNQSRRIEVFIPITMLPEEARHGFKSFWYGSVINGAVVLNRTAPWQYW